MISAVLWLFVIVLIRNASAKISLFKVQDLSNSSYDLVPTSFPTPSGSIGEGWWYLTSSSCYIWGILPTGDNVDAIHDAFESVFFDSIPDLNPVTTIIVTEYVGIDDDDYSDVELSVKYLRLGAVDDDLHRENVEVSVRIWSQSGSTAHQIESILRASGADSTLIMGPLKDEGIDSVSHVLITDIITTLTHNAPPFSATASPARISFVIIGTIVMFGLLGGCISCLVTCRNKHPDALPYVKDRATIVVSMVTPQAMLTKVRNSQGFELANSEEQDQVPMLELTAENLQKVQVRKVLS